MDLIKDFNRHSFSLWDKAKCSSLKKILMIFKTPEFILISLNQIIDNQNDIDFNL